MATTCRALVRCSIEETVEILAAASESQKMHCLASWRQGSGAFVAWFSQIGNAPCPDSGMWPVEPDFDANGEHSMSVIHLDAIFRAAHLVRIAGEDFLPYHMKHTDLFRAFFVFIDYHAHKKKNFEFC